MKKELYEKVLEHIQSGHNELKEYGRSVGDVPHHVWYTLRYLPDESGIKILDTNFEFKAYHNDIADKLSMTRAYDVYPFITLHDEHKSIYLGRVGFMRYNAAAQCFVVSLYPDGYDEVTRNCLPWGKLLKSGIPGTVTAKVVMTTVIWYNFCEVCEGFSYAKDGIVKHTEETYNLLRDYIRDVVRFDMLEFSEFKKRGLMVIERTSTREHINLCGSKLYNILGSDEKCAVRFCYNNDQIVMEWKDGKTYLSNHVALVLPTLSCENFIWMMDRGNQDPGYAIKLCLAGFLTRYKVRLNWNEAYSFIYTHPMEPMNARSVIVKSFNDVL